MLKKPKGKYIYKEYNKKVSKKDFTLVFCFSRSCFVRPIFESINKMMIPLKNCHLLIYDNSCNALLERMLLESIKIYKGVFASLRIYKSYREGTHVIIGMRNYKFKDTKLPPIQEMYEELPKHIETDLFINIEDDTLCPPNTVNDLLSTYFEARKKYKRDVFVTGIESSRHYDENIIPQLAIYTIFEKDGKIIKKSSLSAARYNVVRVHACGHYCFITTKKIWSEGWAYPRKNIDHIKHFAMDVFHTYHLHKSGVPVIANFKVRCDHMQIDPRKIIMWKPSQTLPMLDYYIDEFKVWGYCIPVKKEIYFHDAIC